MAKTDFGKEEGQRQLDGLVGALRASQDLRFVGAVHQLQDRGFSGTEIRTFFGTLFSSHPMVGDMAEAIATSREREKAKEPGK